MAIKEETFNVQSLEGYINELEITCDSVVMAVREINNEIDRVLQTHDGEAGLSGEAGARLANIWENNVNAINSLDELFQKWINSLREVCGVNRELVNSTINAYTER